MPTKVKRSSKPRSKPKPKRSSYVKRRPAFRSFGPSRSRLAVAAPVSLPNPSTDSWLGNIIGKAGSMAGNWLGRITGLGDYKISKNTLLQPQGAMEVPFMHSSKDGVRIRHREFLQDLSSSVTFVNTVYNINPGLSDTFPWLSAIAQNFEEYVLEGCVFEFKTTSADALTSTNTALGTVVLAAEYNVNQSNYINKQQAENSMWSTSAKPSCSQIMPIECDPKLNPFKTMYIRTGAVPSGQDARMYDLCNVQAMTVGSQAVAVVGELWISYDVVLLKPQLQSSLALNANSAHYQLTSPAITSAYFGTAQVLKYDNMGIQFGTYSSGFVPNGNLTSSSTTIAFPLGSQGNYLIQYYVVGTSASCANPTFTLYNCANLDLYFGSTLAHAQGTAATTNYLESYAISISDPTLQAVVVLSSGTIPTSATGADLIITQINGNLNA